MDQNQVAKHPRRTRIKICGIRDIESAIAAVDAGADAIGLVFAEGSPREVSVDQARAVCEVIPPLVDVVGLFTDSSAYEIDRIAGLVGFATVQLHGIEAWNQAKHLEGYRLIGASPFDQDLVEHLVSGEYEWHMRLIDAPPEASGPSGGTGRVADWDALRREDEGLLFQPFMLAGGLTPDNVAEAIRVVRPWGVDVSSGVESSRGVKDLQKIKAFCDAVRNAE
ncbi:MAG: phosphoribosylanthranilate isomerase [Planctomycetota bacterium]